MARHDPRPVKITFGEMRSSGVTGIVVFVPIINAAIDRDARRSMAGRR
jgi:hypothetical protein